MSEVKCTQCGVSLTGIRTVFYDRLFSSPFCSERCLKIHFIDNVELVIDKVAANHIAYSVDLIDNNGEA